MSLTAILRSAEGRDFFSEKIRNPGIEPEPETRVPPEAESPQRVGMAFDYALRAGLEARYDAVERRTVAETAINELNDRAVMGDVGVDVHKVEKQLQDSLQVLSSVTDAETLPRDAARACYRLAGMEVFHRSRYTDQVNQAVTDTEIEELQSLFELVPWERFEPADHLYLNPTFGEASKLVRGADADLVVDDIVVEIKTAKRQRPRIKTFRQLGSYAMFARQYGLNGQSSPVPTSQLGIYFSRAGELRMWSFDEVVEDGAPHEIMKFLTDFY